MHASHWWDGITCMSDSACACHLNTYIVRVMLQVRKDCMTAFTAVVVMVVVVVVVSSLLGGFPWMLF